MYIAWYRQMEHLGACDILITVAESRIRTFELGKSREREKKCVEISVGALSVRVIALSLFTQWI